MQAVLWFTSRGLRNRGRIVKVVLFCGGFGTRLREYSETIPKPLVDVGHRPIIWHLMKYYEHHGHSDFILCLGYQGRMIKEYFLNYDECMSNDFVMTEGGKNVELYNRDIDNWRITFVDTGLNANLGERLLAVRKYLGDDEFFLANYSDGLSDLPLLDHIEMTQDRRALAGFVGINEVMGVHHRLLLNFTAGYGFTGIAVSLMGRNHPVGIVLASLLFGMLYQGGAELAFEEPKVTRELVVTIQGLVILFSGALAFMMKGPIERAYLRIAGGFRRPAGQEG